MLVRILDHAMSVKPGFAGYSQEALVQLLNDIQEQQTNDNIVELDT